MFGFTIISCSWIAHLVELSSYEEHNVANEPCWNIIKTPLLGNIFNLFERLSAGSSTPGLTKIFSLNKNKRESYVNEWILLKIYLTFVNV